jgi:hypothetical protein
LLFFNAWFLPPPPPHPPPPHPPRAQAAEAADVARLVDEARSTAPGAKKVLPPDMYKAYHPQMVEAAWYDW